MCSLGKYTFLKKYVGSTLVETTNHQDYSKIFGGNVLV